MAEIIDEKDLARQIRDKIKVDVAEHKASSGHVPGLAIVQVGNREDSNVYVRTKLKFAKELGMNAEIFKMPSTTTEAELLETVNHLNHNDHWNGIIVQLPLDSVNPINSSLATNAVCPEKDVDGGTAAPATLYQVRGFKVCIRRGAGRGGRGVQYRR